MTKYVVAAIAAAGIALGMNAAGLGYPGSFGTPNADLIFLHVGPPDAAPPDTGPSGVDS